MLFLMGSTGPDWICPWCGRDGLHGYSPDRIGYPICSDFLDKTSAAAVALEDHGVDNTCLGMVCDLGWDRADFSSRCERPLDTSHRSRPCQKHREISVEVLGTPLTIPVGGPQSQRTGLAQRLDASSRDVLDCSSLGPSGGKLRAVRAATDRERFPSSRYYQRTFSPPPLSTVCFVRGRGWGGDPPHLRAHSVHLKGLPPLPT